jgi:RimJ/RimL family protein N-acetyltransferase
VTPRLALRETTEADLPTLFEQQLDPAAHRMVAFVTRDPADREAFFAHWKKVLADAAGTRRTIVVEGSVAGHLVKWGRLGEPQIGYWLGRAYWGRGLATEALSAFVREIEVRPLWAGAAADNLASIRVLEKCGFTIAGRERAYAAARGAEIEETILVLR